jgi:hypothetical protein
VEFSKKNPSSSSFVVVLGQRMITGQTRSDNQVPTTPPTGRVEIDRYNRSKWRRELHAAAIIPIHPHDPIRQPSAIPGK